MSKEREGGAGKEGKERDLPATKQLGSRGKGPTRRAYFALQDTIFASECILLQSTFLPYDRLVPHPRRLQRAN